MYVCECVCERLFVLLLRRVSGAFVSVWVLGCFRTGEVGVLFVRGRCRGVVCFAVGAGLVVFLWVRGLCFLE